MKKIIGACSALVLAAILGLFVVEKAFTMPPPPPQPAPTNAAPASINCTVQNSSGVIS